MHHDLSKAIEFAAELAAQHACTVYVLRVENYGQTYRYMPSANSRWAHQTYGEIPAAGLRLMARVDAATLRKA